MALNKLAFHNVLVREMDASSEAAEQLAELVDDGIQGATTDLLTKQDLQVAVHQLTTDFRTEILRLLKWLTGLGFVIGGGLIGLLAALVAKL